MSKESGISQVSAVLVVTKFTYKWVCSCVLVPFYKPRHATLSQPCSSFRAAEHLSVFVYEMFYTSSSDKICFTVLIAGDVL